MNTWRCLGLLLVGLLGPGSLPALTDTWDGGGTDNNIQTGANWLDNTAPAISLTNTDLIFTGFLRTTPNFAASFLANSVEFDSGASAFTFTGQALTIGTGGITNNSVELQRFNNSVTIGNASITNSTFTAASGNLQFNGTVGLGTNTLTLAGNETITFGGSVTGTGTVIQSGNGTFHYGTIGNQTQGWDLTLSNGTTHVSASTNLTLSSSSTVSVTGGAYEVDGNLTVQGGSLLDSSGGVAFNGQRVRVESGGTIALFGDYDLASDDITVTGTGSKLFTDDGNLTLSGLSSLSTLTGGNVTSERRLDIATQTGDNVAVLVNGTGAVLRAVGAAPSAWGAGGGLANITFSNSATGNFLGGLHLAGSGNGTQASVSVLSGASLALGSLSIADTSDTSTGSLLVSGSGSSVTQSGNSTLTLGGTANSTGSLAVADGATFTTGTGNATVRATGTVALNGGTLSTGGNLILDGGQLTRNATGTLAIGSGRLFQVQNGGNASFEGDFGIAPATDVVVTGPGSTLVTTGAIGLGQNLSTLAVLAGGSASAGTGVDVGIGSGNTSSLLVDGAGSALAATGLSTWGAGGGSANITFSNSASGNLSGGIHIAGSGNGTQAAVSVLSGADLGTGDISLGNTTDAATASLVVSGNGSSVTQAGTASLVLGSTTGSNSTLTILDGASFTSGTGNTVLNTTGTVHLDGGTLTFLGHIERNGGSLNFVSGNLNLTDDLVVEEGGLLGANLTLLANRRVSTAGFASVVSGQTLTIDGGNLTAQAGLSAQADSAVLIQNGGVVSAAGSTTLLTNSSLTLTGNGSALTTTGSVSADHQGAAVNVLSNAALRVGTLNLATSGGNSASLLADGNATLNATSGTSLWGRDGGNASVTFSDGARGNFTGAVDIAGSGNGTQGTLAVISGGNVTVANLTVANTLDTANGTVLVSGNGSRLRQAAGSHIVIGSASGSNATLRLESGGGFIGGSGGEILVNPTGLISLTDNSTLFTSGGANLTVSGGRFEATNNAAASLNNLRVESGGLFSNRTLSITSSRNLVVTGNGSRVVLSNGTTGALSLSSGATGTIESGGLVDLPTGGSASVSSNASLTITTGGELRGGSLSITDASVTFSNGATGSGNALNVGEGFSTSANSVLSVLSGATLSTGSTLLATTSSSIRNATVLVSGNGSSVIQSGNASLTVGAAGNSSATLTVADGASFTTGTGNTTINGTGTIAVNGGSFFANGNLIVNGGQFFNGSNVTAHGGQLTRNATGNLSLAEGKRLTVSGNSATVAVEGDWQLWDSATLSVSHFSATDAATISTTGALRLGSGNTSLLVDGYGQLVAGGGIHIGASPGQTANVTLVNGSFGNLTAGNASTSHWGRNGGTANVTVVSPVSLGHLEIAGAGNGTLATVTVLPPSAFNGTNGRLRTGNLSIANTTDAATGTLSVGGQVLQSADAGIVVGAASGSSGELVLTGLGEVATGNGGIVVNPTGNVSRTNQNTYWTINGTAAVLGGRMEIGGALFNGDVRVEAGGLLTIDYSRTFSVLGAGRNMTVTGPGSTFTHNSINSGSLLLSGGAALAVSDGGNYSGPSTTIQLSGNASLTVSNGGTITGSLLGISGNGTQTVLVDGPGSSLDQAAPFNNPWGSGGSMSTVTFSNQATGNFAGAVGIAGSAFGVGGTVQVSVLSGAALQTRNLTLATTANGSNGTFLVSGANSSVTQGGNSTLILGSTSNSSALLTVADAATFTTGTGNTTINATGTLAVNGGTFHSLGNLTVNGGQLSRNATGNVNLAADRTFRIQAGGDAVFEGDFEPGTGVATVVTGAGSSLTATGNIGIGTQAGSASTLTVDAGTLTAGNSATSHWGRLGGSANVTFQNNALASFAGGLEIAGDGANTTATVSVLSGADLVAGNLSIARTSDTATGSLLLSGNGSSILQTGASTLMLGSASGSNATLIVAGGSFTTGTGNTTVHTTGNIVVNGGAFQVAGNLIVAGGRVEDASGGLDFGGAELRVDSGGFLKLPSLALDSGPSALFVSGAGSNLTNAGSSGPLTLSSNVLATVTDDGRLSWSDGAVAVLDSASLAVTDGGDLSAGLLAISTGAGDDAELLVDGPGASVTVGALGDSVWGGTGGHASVTFANGGAGNFDGLIRIAAGSGSSGNVSVLSGAELSMNSLELGLSSGSANASFLVSDAGSSVAQAGASTLVIGSGNAGATLLRVADEGTFATGTGDVFLNPTGAIEINGGTLDLRGRLIRAGGSLAFQSGTLKMIDDLVVGTGGLLGTSLTLLADRVLVTTGNTTVQTGRTLALNGGTLSTGALIANGTLSLQSGTLAITGPGGLQIGGGGPLGGSASLGTGMTLQVTTGPTAILAGASLAINGGSLTASNLTNAGTLRANSGFASVAEGVNASTGRIFVADSLSVSGNLVNQSGGRLVLEDGTGLIQGPGHIQNAGLLQGDGTVASGVTNTATGEIRGEFGKTLTFAGANGPNSGRINLLGGTVQFNQALTNNAGGQINGYGNLYLPTSPEPSSGNPDAGLNNSGNLNFSGGDTHIFGTVAMNAGSRLITSGGATTTFYDVFRHNGAEVRASTGSNIVFFGEVRGAGNFTGAGTIYMEGGYNPGNSPAAVGIETSLVFGDAFTLTLEIGGANAGTGYDQLLLGGTASLALNGTLIIDLIDGYTPEAGTAFQLFQFAPGQVTGNFDRILFADSGAEFDTGALLSDGSITFQGIPEPGSALLLFVGLLPALMRRRRLPGSPHKQS